MADGTARHPWRERIWWLLPVTYTIGWAVYVSASGQWDRVAQAWRTSVTMLFGSFVAGSTPQGGGAVAFPVFTKVLDITAPVARSFSLTIQATGMIMASATILIAGRKIDRRAIALGTMGGLVGFGIGAFVLSDPSTLWWESRIPAPWVKVGFTIAIAAMARIVHLCFIGGAGGHAGLDHWPRRAALGLFGFAVTGGVASALAGSGADVFLFLFVVLIIGVHPKVGIPSSIITMALISVAGLVVFGLVGGQLSIGLDAAGDVVSVGDRAVSPPLDGSRFDLFGIWLAASVIVVWGAPLGSWAASVAPDRWLIMFVGLMAVAEVATTILFLEPLRTDPALAAFGVVGLVAAFLAVQLLVRHRPWFLSGGPAPTDSAAELVEARP